MDRRVQETQNKMVVALRALMQRYPWESITIAIICQESSVSRSTFYSHFDSKDDLMKLALQYLALELAPVHTRRSLDSAFALKFLPGLLMHVKDHRQIMQQNADTAAAGMIRKNLARTIEGLIENEIRDSGFSNSIDGNDLLFMCGGLGAIIDQWIDRECDESVASVVTTIDRMVGRWLTHGI